MASKLIGRAACPECGFGAAHVKESEKCLYRYCPECGSQHHARSDRQRADLMAKTRPEGTPTPTPKQEPQQAAKPEPVAVPTPSEPTPTPTQEAKTTATPKPTPEKPKRRGLFG